jgi:hypothetical protein
VGAVGVASHDVDDDGLVGSWVLTSTDVLCELLEAGRTLRLPGLEGDAFASLAGQGSTASGDALDIVSIEEVDADEVMCISVADDDHMYVTDGFIATHNTSNIVFLKSTDDSMLDTLEKMSGKTHRTVAESKTVTQDAGKVVMRNEDKHSITYTTREEPVISYNQMAFLGERQSIVFRASDPPVLNKNQMILPMSWRLFLNKIRHPGHDYSLQTIPTLSSAAEFDARKNLPQFEEMVDERLMQACFADQAREIYKYVHGIKSDYEVEQLDPDIYSEAVMEICNMLVSQFKSKAAPESVDAVTGVSESSDEVRVEAEREAAKRSVATRRRFAGGQLSRSDLYDNGFANHSYDSVIAGAYSEHKDEFIDDRLHFAVMGESLFSHDRTTLFIEGTRAKASTMTNLGRAAADPGSRVSDPGGALRGEGRVDVGASLNVTDEFIIWLSAQENWNGIAGGVLERALAAAIVGGDE